MASVSQLVEPRHLGNTRLRSPAIIMPFMVAFLDGDRDFCGDGCFREFRGRSDQLQEDLTVFGQPQNSLASVSEGLCFFEGESEAGFGEHVDDGVSCHAESMPHRGDGGVRS